MIKVLFVCHGNICRSPMAEFMFKDMISKRGLEEMFYVESAATSDEECWNGIVIIVKFQHILKNLHLLKVEEKS